MKKYLIKGLLALVVGGFTASCADKDGEYVPVSQQKATAYADAFKELIGGEVAPNHDWGFTKTSIVSETAQTRTNTRAFTRADGVGMMKKMQLAGVRQKVYQNTWHPLQMLRESGFKHGLIILIIEVCLRKVENFIISMFSKYTTNSILMRKTIKMDISGK